MAPKFQIQTIFSAIDKLTGPTRTMTRSVDKFSASASKGISGITQGVGRLRGFLVSAAAILTTGVIAKSITDFAEKAHDVGNMANVLGMSATALQELQYAAKMTDVDSEALTTTFKKMNNSLGQLKVGGGSLYEYLKKTNPHLAVQLRTTKDSSDAFMLLMDAISKETDTSKRAALTQAAFGKSGQEIIKMALEGSDGIARLRKEAYEYGSVISEGGVKQSERFSESLKRMTGSINYLKNAALEELVRALSPVLENVLAWVKANREFLKQKIHDAVDKIVKAATTLYAIAEKVWQAWDRLNKMDNGHLARDILILAAAWKAVTIAIGLAKAAQVAFNLVSGGGAAKGVAGAAAGAAEGAIGSGAAKWAGRFAGGGSAIAASGAGAAIAAAAVPAAVVTGAALLGQMYASWQNSMITDPGQIAGGNRALMSEKQRIAYDAKKAEAHVTIDFSNMPAGVSVRSGSNGGVSLNLGPTARKRYAAAAGGSY